MIGKSQKGNNSSWLQHAPFDKWSLVLDRLLNAMFWLYCSRWWRTRDRSHSVAALLWRHRQNGCPFLLFPRLRSVGKSNLSPLALKHVLLGAARKPSAAPRRAALAGCCILPALPLVSMTTIVYKPQSLTTTSGCFFSPNQVGSFGVAAAASSPLPFLLRFTMPFWYCGRSLSQNPTLPLSLSLHSLLSLPLIDIFQASLLSDNQELVE